MAEALARLRETIRFRSETRAMPFETPHVPAQSEGESNASPRRREWAAGALGETSQRLLDEDARLFLH